MRRIVFRADGSAENGLGHIMRLLALVELLRDRFNCIFLSNNVDELLKNIILKSCSAKFIEVANVEEEMDALKLLLTGEDIFVTDGYNFNEEYQIKIKKIVYKLVMIDDKADMFYHADLIINHGLDQKSLIYKSSADTKILTGFKYLIARKEFLSAATQKKNVKFIDTVFICMGGSDPYHITMKVLEACRYCDYIKKIYIVIGGLYNDKIELEKLIAQINDKVIFCFQNVSSRDMVKYIELSHIAFSTASSIAMEICCVKSGLITGVVVDNQNYINQQIVNNGCGYSVGNWSEISINEIVKVINKINKVSIVNAIIKNQSNFIDGKSGERIINFFNEIAA